MLHQLISMPHHQHFFLACSGGIDSMTIANFYKRGEKSFTIAYFNHATPQANEFEEFVSSWAKKNAVPFVRSQLTNSKPKEQSKEEFWRTERYRWFSSLPGDVVVCQHLSDVAETWLFSALHGNPKVILPRWNNIVRPFLTTTKDDIKKWASKHDVKWIEDKSNANTDIPRNNIRHNMIRYAEQINPGLLTVMRKKVLAMVDGDSQ